MKPFKILLLDDDDSLRFNLQMFLTDEGLNVTPASSGEMALELLDTDSFDLAIVDIRLPGMNGEKFIKSAALKEPQMKYIIHTGSTKYTLPSELAGYNINESQVFNKPINDLTLLIKKIRTLLDHE